MKKITTIEESLKTLKPKMDIGASDWTKKEKECIEQCYHEITKVSVGFGRTVDLGCSECVQSAVNIIKNYVAIQERSATPSLKVVASDWTKDLKSIQAKADELSYEFAKNCKTKAQRIEALHKHLQTIEDQKEFP